MNITVLWMEQISFLDCKKKCHELKWKSKRKLRVQIEVVFDLKGSVWKWNICVKSEMSYLNVSGECAEECDAIWGAECSDRGLYNPSVHQSGHSVIGIPRYRSAQKNVTQRRSHLYPEASGTGSFYNNYLFVSSNYSIFFPNISIKLFRFQKYIQDNANGY